MRPLDAGMTYRTSPRMASRHAFAFQKHAIVHKKALMTRSSRLIARARSTGAAGLITLALAGCLTEPERSGSFNLTVTGDLTISLSGTVSVFSVLMDNRRSGYRMDLEATGSPGYVVTIALDDRGEPAVGTYEFQDLSAPGPCETQFFPLVAYFSASNGSASRYQSSRGYVRITDVSLGRIRGEMVVEFVREDLVSLVTFQCGRDGKIISSNVPASTLRVSGSFEAKR